LTRYATIFAVAILVSAFVTVARATEYGGVVTGAGVPIPGATVTATHDDKQITTTTDQSGTFHFPNLDDGAWTVRVEMLGFAGQTQEITVATGIEPSKWTLQLRSAQEFVSSIGATPAPRVTAGASPSRTSAPAAAPNRSAASNTANATNAPNTTAPATAAPSAAPSPPSDPFGTADGYQIGRASCRERV